MNIVLPDGSKKELADGSTVADVAASIGAGLAKAALAGIVNDQPVDLSAPVAEGDSVAIVTAKSDEGLELLRHSTAHVMAAALVDLYGDVQFGVGPAIEDGFYYDVKLDRALSPDDFAAIEARMAEIVKADEAFERRVVTRVEAEEIFASQPFKLELIAEDLGDLDQDALHFVRTCGIPGMKVMVFAFDPQGESAYLPHNCQPFSVVYTGTHDTPTFVQFLNEARLEEASYARRYLRLREEEGLGWGVISGAWASGSYLAIAPLQDVLGLGADARMNTPGTMGDHNWSWRVRSEALNPYVSGKLREITRTYRRCL